jgi:hypothetical protein
MRLSQQFITNRWGLQGGHRDLFMLDALRNIYPVRMTGDEAASSKVQKRPGEFNRVE